MINNYIAFTLLTASFLCGQDSPQSVDGVAAVVGENIILKSDVSQVVGIKSIKKSFWKNQINWSYNTYINRRSFFKTNRL